MGLVAGTILEVKVGYKVNDQQCYNVLHYAQEAAYAGAESPTTITSEFLNTNANELDADDFQQQFAAMFGSNVVVNEVTAQIVFPTRYALQRSESNTAGARATQCEVQNVHATIVKKGELGNRHNIGSMHLGGIPTSEIDNGLLSGGYKADLETFIDFMLDSSLGVGIAGVSFVPCILNKTKVVVDGKDKYPISGYSVITDWEYRDQVSTQRTRTVGRGI